MRAARYGMSARRSQDRHARHVRQEAAIQNGDVVAVISWAGHEVSLTAGVCRHLLDRASTDLFLGRLPPFGVGRASRARWTEGPIIGSAGAEAKAVGHVRGVKMRLLYGFLQRSGNQTTVSVCVPSSVRDWRQFNRVV